MSEKSSLDAVFIGLEKHFCINLDTFERKDEKNHLSKEIEGIFSTRNSELKFAIEHTSVDLFENQRKYGFEFQKLKQFILEDLGNALNLKGNLLITISTNYLMKKYRKHQDEIFKKISTVIKEKINYEFANFSDDLLDFEVTITGNWKQTRNGNGKIFIFPGFEIDFETRFSRFKRAIVEKCPKLSKYRTSNIKTVLIIEDIDIYNSGYENILNMFSRLSIPDGLEPDYIFYLTSSEDRILDCSLMKNESVWQRFEETVNYLE